MAGGAVRGALGAWLGLVMIQKLTTYRGSLAVSTAADMITSLVKRAADPKVPLIPDLAGGGKWGGGGTGTANTTPSTPGNQYGSADAAEAWRPPAPGYLDPGRVGGTY